MRGLGTILPENILFSRNYESAITHTMVPLTSFFGSGTMKLRVEFLVSGNLLGAKH